MTRTTGIALAAMLLLGSGCSPGSPYSYDQISPVAVETNGGLLFYRIRLSGTLTMRMHGGERMNVDSRILDIYRLSFPGHRLHRIAQVDGDELLPRGASWSEEFLLLDEAPWVRWQGDARKGCLAIPMPSGNRADVCTDHAPFRMEIGEAGKAQVFSLEGYFDQRATLDPRPLDPHSLLFDYAPGLRRILVFDQESVVSEKYWTYPLARVSQGSTQLIRVDIPANHRLLAARPANDSAMLLVQSVDATQERAHYFVYKQGAEGPEQVAAFDCAFVDIDCGSPIAFVPDRSEVYFGSPDRNERMRILGISYLSGRAFAVDLDPVKPARPSPGAG